MKKLLLCLTIIIACGFITAVAEAADPVLCRGGISDNATGASVGVQNEGVFDIDGVPELTGITSSKNSLTVAETDGYIVTVRRLRSSAILKTPEIVIEVWSAPISSVRSERLAFAGGQNHIALGFKNNNKDFLFNCDESAYMKAHYDGLCGNIESQKMTSPYRKTCENLCKNAKRYFSSEAICLPYLQ